MKDVMRRREFITFIGGAVAMPSMLAPLSARAQQPGRLPRVAVVMVTSSDDPQSQLRLAAFINGLEQAGWAPGRTIQIDARWTSGDTARTRADTADLLALSPDVLVAGGRGALVVPVVRQLRQDIPIVFAQGVDPVGSGYVTGSMARPAGNVTGFVQLEYTLSGKWLQLLKEIAPSVTRVGVLREAGSAGIGQWAVIQAAASPLAIELTPIATHDPGEIERGIAAFAAEPNGGLIVAVSSTGSVHRALIISLAAKHRLPTVYPYHYFTQDGGLMSYGADLVDQYRRAASYVDRILKGDKPSDLPVQTPTKYELFINLKTANALGLDVPAQLLARADEVIE